MQNTNRIIDSVKNAGVVGAGGAGFPTHVKLDCTAQTVIANGAECEPLLRVDRLLMEHYAARVTAGLKAAMEAVAAKVGIIAVKAHYHGAVDALNREIKGNENIRLHLLESFYPAGDEKSLIHEITGQVVPSGRLPRDEGCIVCNVGTLVNIADALDGKPVVDKLVTVGGEVKTPVTLRAPIGIPFRELLEKAGFNGSKSEYALIVGGPCMGRLEEDWDAPVTKTTSGLLLFRRSHASIAKRTVPLQRQIKLAQAVCCQCSYCTQLCPRNALGLGTSPHKAMRALAYADTGLPGGANGVLACSSCGLCTNYACTMGLTPSAVMAGLKDELARAGIRPRPEPAITADADYRVKRIPTSRLIARMGLSEFDTDAPLMDEAVRTRRVRIPLSMHIGKPSEPTVAVGEPVLRGDMIAAIPPNSLGAAVHASISGAVTRIAGEYIEITEQGG